MTKMEHLNSFFVEKLLSVAGEIFEAVKEAVSEYQGEIERTKQENRRLRDILTEISVSASSELRAPDLQPSHAEGSPVQQDSNQRPLDSDPSVLQLKLELATIKQEIESQPPLNDVSASSSPCAKSVHDTWTSHTDGVLHEPQNTSQGLQDPAPSLIQVKLELATMQENTGPQPQLSVEKRAGGQKPPQSVSWNAVDAEGRKDDRLHGNTLMIIKLEPCDPEEPHPSDTRVQSKNHSDFVEPEPAICPSVPCNPARGDLPDAAAPSAEKSLSCGVCDKPLTSAWLRKKHRITCPKERPYRCDLCGKSYGDVHVLRLHLKTHTTERPFQCQSCGKMYKKKSHLKDHERTHTGDKRYSCSACGMCFIWTNQVKVHIQNHHRGQLATVLKKVVPVR
ncbi:uncharacterized protein [Salminus brasiliensis]|uniref:uncharacterized protein n=1 Tax=Salminus brasiliensis TaxID=930266 RepID=UPI003B830A84